MIKLCDLNMIKKIIAPIFILLLLSCSLKGNDKNTDAFVKFVAREEYMKEIEPNRVFNPDPAALIATLPDRIGNLTSVGQINDFELVNNGLGYSKRYINKSFGSGYWVDVFAYHSRQSHVSVDIDDEIVMAVYGSSKDEILGSYKNAKLIEENTIIFTTPDGKVLKMREAIFEFENPAENTKVKSYMYFGTNLDSFYKVRISYNLNFDGELRSDKEIFIRDLGYYYAEGMSLDNFNRFKKSGKKNPVKMQRKRI